MYERGRGFDDGPAEVLGRSEGSRGDTVSDEGWAWRGRSESCVSGGETVGCDGAGGCGCEAVLGRGLVSGAEEIRLLCRRSSSACSVLTGDEGRQNLLFGLIELCSKSAIASDTGTLLAVVWFSSSRRIAIWFSSRSASRSMTRSIDERER